MDAMSDELPGPTGNRPWGELFLDLATGKASALEELYDAVAGRIFGLALWRTGSSEDASDVVQEVFVRLVEQGESKIREPGY